MPVHITLTDSKADRFVSVKEHLSEEFGYELSNPEVVGILMTSVDLEAQTPRGTESGE